MGPGGRPSLNPNAGCAGYSPKSPLEGMAGFHGDAGEKHGEVTTRTVGSQHESQLDRPCSTDSSSAPASKLELSTFRGIFHKLRTSLAHGCANKREITVSIGFLLRCIHVRSI